MEKKVIGETTNSNVALGATTLDTNGLIIFIDTSLSIDTSKMYLPIQGTNVVIDWGDGTVETVTQTSTPSLSNAIEHNYGGETCRFIKITGGLQRIDFSVASIHSKKVVAIESFGNHQYTTLVNAFENCSKLTKINTTVPPDLSNITSMTGTFGSCSAYYSDFSNWDVSDITSFSTTFYQSSFRGTGLANWNMSSATNLYLMMDGASNFNEDISGWNVSNVTDFMYMLRRAKAFNQNLGGWQLKLSGTIQMFEIFRENGMSVANYTDTLVGWANYLYDNSGTTVLNITGQNGKTFDTSRSGGANFTTAGDARNYLISLGATISNDTVI